MATQPLHLHSCLLHCYCQRQPVHASVQCLECCHLLLASQLAVDLHTGLLSTCKRLHSVAQHVTPGCMVDSSFRTRHANLSKVLCLLISSGGIAHQEITAATGATLLGRSPVATQHVVSPLLPNTRVTDASCWQLSAATHTPFLAFLPCAFSVLQSYCHARLSCKQNIQTSIRDLSVADQAPTGSKSSASFASAAASAAAAGTLL